MDVPSHHTRQTVCATRLPYREGRVPKAVKVYTINNESRYLLVQGIPSVGAGKNLLQLFSKYGQVDEHYALDEYPCEDKYTEVYLFKYKKIQSARFAKRKLDDYSFFGGTLHVCYAPEHETVQETREKLQDRRKMVARKISQHAQPTRPQHTQSQQVASLTQDMNKQGTTGTSNAQNISDEHSACLTHNPVPPLPPTDRYPHPFPSQPIHQPSYSEVTLPGQSFQCHSNLGRFKHQRDVPFYQDSQTNVQYPQETFELPAPPKQHLSQMQVRPRRNCEFSRVPSAHATLPPGFDGRLNPQVGHPIPDSLSTEPLQQKPSTVPSSVIRDFKPKTTTPKFVPRQALKRKSDGTGLQKDSAPPPQTKVPTVDPLDEQLRQNAFKLRKVQGPENVSVKKEAVKVNPDVEKSMLTTIKSIRSKISQVISDTVKNPT